MNKVYSLLILLFVMHNNSSAQNFIYQLTGNPINTTGWDYGTMSSVSGNEFILTTNTTNQSGYIYYNTPVNLTECSYYTVDFQFQITNSSSPTADGLAFWYISNPPTGFTGGGGIGLPNNPNGLVLIFDTYDNNSTPDNPLVSLRRLDGTFNYTEGVTTGQLTPDATNQSVITNGNWHSVKLVYDNGNITVSLNNVTLLTGYSNMNGFTGYFGFSAGTGSLWARHAIREVSITGVKLPEPPVVPIQNFSYCVGDVAQPIIANGTNLRWYKSLQSGTFDTATPVVSTAIPGVYNWYVSEYFEQCNYETEKIPITVTVHVNPLASIEPKNIAQCYGDSIPLSVTTIPMSNGHDINWFPAQYLNRDTGYTNNFFSTPGEYTVMVNVTNKNSGCFGKDSIKIKIAPKPIINVYPEDTTIMLGHGIQLNAFANDIKTWIWYPSYYLSDPQINNPFATPKDDITYTVYGTNEWGCMGDAKINIEFSHKDSLRIPNAFSPNGDGLNDFFNVHNIKYEQILKFVVYNRYGEMVYDGKNPDIGWDGYFKGQPAPLGVYSYNIIINIPFVGVRNYKGDVTLIR